MERAIVRDVRMDLSTARVEVTGVGHHPGTAARVFRLLDTLGVTATVAGGQAGVITFLAAPGPALERAVRQLGLRARVDRDIAVVTLRGAGLRTDPAVLSTFCEALLITSIRLDLVTAEATRISAVCARDRARDAVAALCEAFEVPVAEPLEVACAV
ncbi:hypothetical protein [Actinokineospora xionganensis]|uniref:Aspartate kinase n=1 Tax=Actinokineospora xionganensis TaxID=2684470 RepID=A0ABR7LCP5_9PSEU|nr:hypothetical protein [Actinokineospora xionganensis]MBC6450154.1 hypothetical protein [Actinokineospora xionganensis]